VTKVAVPQVVADCELMFAHLRQHGSARGSKRVPAYTRDSDPSECRLNLLLNTEARTVYPFESKPMYNPPMQGLPWSTIALGSLLLIAARSTGGQQVKSPEPEKSKPPVKTEQRGRILGIGGVFFKSANRDQMREWYAKHLGLADKGQGAMLPWREHDDPQKEHLTVWTVFPASSDYFPPSQPFMINYIVDDMDALLDRLKQEGVKIDPKRMDESYGRFAWIYDSDGNKIELWQPLPAKP
jgi:catechol 2,3-dioxygenase-like lactoylglutathione lyase family enzyme